MDSLLNFSTRLNLEDYGLLQSNAVLEFKKHINLLRTFDSDSFGILSKESVNLNLTTSSSFYVVESQQVKRLDIYPGIAVTKAGDLIIVDTLKDFIALASETPNTINLIIAEFAYTDTNVQKKQNLYGDNPLPYKTILEDPIKVVTLDDYENITLFSSTRKENIVILGVAYVNNEDLLVVDLTTDIFSYNRPRFSIEDTVHRSSKGSGSPTDNNPHGLSLNDLTAGKLSFFKQLKTQGLLISKDIQAPNKPGCLDKITVAANSFTQDTTGDITGVVNAWYTKLPSFINKTIFCYETAYVQNKIGVSMVEGTNIMHLNINEIPLDVTVGYFASKALTPSIVNDTLSFAQPTDTELLFSQGLEVTSIENPDFNLRTLGPIANKYKMYLKGDNTLQLNPFIIYPNTKVNTFTGVKTFTGTLSTPSKILFAMRTVNSESMQFRLVGKDSNGTAITETLDLSAITPVPTLPSIYVPGQFLETVNIFSVVDTLEFIGTLQDVDSTFMLFVDYKDSLYDAMEALSFSWDGLDVVNLRDLRKVKPMLVENQLATHISEALLPIVLTSLSLAYKKPFMIEDFSRNTYKDYSCLDVDATISFGYVEFVIDLSILLIANGDTLNLPNGKVMEAKTIGADTALGQFNIGTNLTEMHTNFLDALHDVDFDSGVTGDDETTKIKLNIDSGETNYLLTKTTTNPNALNISGFDKGYNQEVALETSWEHPFLASSPDPIETNKTKYRSRVFTSDTDKILFIGKGVKNITHIRLKPCYTDRPLVWQPFVDFVAINSETYLFTNAEPNQVSKFYIEVVGTLEGFNLYNY